MPFRKVDPEENERELEELLKSSPEARRAAIKFDWEVARRKKQFEAKSDEEKNAFFKSLLEGLEEAVEDAKSTKKFLKRTKRTIRVKKLRKKK